MRAAGDRAIRELTLQFDKVELNDLRVSKDEIDAASRALSPELKKSIQQAAENIRRFHLAQRREPLVIETMPGVTCWRGPKAALEIAAEMCRTLVPDANCDFRGADTVAKQQRASSIEPMGGCAR